jgi:serine/threonine protein kinase
MENFAVKRKVGQGAQGVVYRAVDIRSGEIVAIKQIDASCLDDKARAAALAEVQVLETLRDDPHPCIMGYRTSFIHDDMLCMVLDWCDGGTMQDLLDAGRDAGTMQSEDFIWHALVSLSSALQHCHKRGILHRDVKLANIFLEKERGDERFPRLRLGDFGVACVLDDRSRARTVVGTPYYLSPELCCGEPYDAKSDIWSLGVALYQLCNDRLPFNAANYAALIMAIVQAQAAKQTVRYSRPLHAIVSRCMKKAPAARPTAAAILGLPEVRQAGVRVGLAALLPDNGSAANAEAASSNVAALPLRRSSGVPSRRVRNRVIASMRAPPVPVAPPPTVYRPASSTVRAPPKGAYLRRAPPAGVPEHAPPAVEEPKPTAMSEAARRRAAQAVADLPDFGSDSDSKSVGRLRQTEVPTECTTLRDASPDKQSGSSDDAAREPDEVVDEVGNITSTSTSFSPVVMWRIDDESGVANGSATFAAVDLDDAADAGPDDEDDDRGESDEERPVGTASMRSTSSVTSAGHAAALLAEVQDEAELFVEPATFVELVDALRHEASGRFEALLGSIADEHAKAELTYLCYRYIFLASETAGSAS